MSFMVVALLTTITAAQTPAPQGTPDLAARGKAVLDHVVAGEFSKVEEQFTPEMKAALPPGRLATAWSTVLMRVGAFKQCESDARVVTIGDKQMVIRKCAFERSQVDIQFAFDSAGKISGLNFRPGAAIDAPSVLPPYATPSSYSEVAVTIGSGDWAVPGVLSLPHGTTKAPAVVLVHGSGPGDRDGSLGPNKPLRDLAVGLASRGIAVLRYDKRTRVYGAKLAAVQGFTVRQEVIEDVIQAVNALRAHPRIDASRVFVLGHSMGGMLVPRIAEADPTIAGFVVLAGPARSIEDALVAQTRYIANADGTITPDEQKGIDDVLKLAESLRALKPSDADSSPVIFGAPVSYWLDLRGYDPATAAKAIKNPMLILQGERDYQVTMEEFARWKTTLAPQRHVTFRSYPTLNHVFMSGSGPSRPEEYLVPGHVAEEVIRDIADWIASSRTRDGVVQFGESRSDRSH